MLKVIWCISVRVFQNLSICIFHFSKVKKNFFMINLSRMHGIPSFLSLTNHSLQFMLIKYLKYHNLSGFPGDSVVKNPPAKQEMQVRSLGREDPLEKEMATHWVFLPGKFHGQRSLVSYIPLGHRSDMTSTKQQKMVEVF